MAKCNKCGQTITFKEHPQNPAKKAPFNEDGTIHFATCSAKRDDQRRVVAVVFTTLRRCLQTKKTRLL